jgi:hypothetical protein
MTEQELKIKRQAEKILGAYIFKPRIIEMSNNGKEVVGVFRSGRILYDFVIEPEAEYPIQYRPQKKDLKKLQ